MDVLPAVEKFVRDRRATGMPIYLTGHSLGGVLATLAASMVDATATYTFGAPRAGNSKFAEGLAGKNVHRVVYGLDIAPSYPHPLLGYRHGGERWQLDSDGALTQSGAWCDLFHFPVAKGVLDHRVTNYADGLADPRYERRPYL
jgi:predicted lipase